MYISLSLFSNPENFSKNRWLFIDRVWFELITINLWCFTKYDSLFIYYFETAVFLHMPYKTYTNNKTYDDLHSLPLKTVGYNISSIWEYTI